MADQPQSNYQDSQNFDINIGKMFKDFVTGGTSNGSDTSQNVAIDDLRSQINIEQTFQTTANLIASLNIGSSDKPASTANTTTPGQVIQESRCHAFFRIIGFPVIDASFNLFYNPGLDIIKDGTTVRERNLDKKIAIAKNPIPGFEDLSKTRELYQNATAQIFSNPSTLEAGILSLTSGTYYQKSNVNLRKFSVPFDKNGSDWFDTKIADQSYAIGTGSLVGLNEVLFNNYRDGSGVEPNFGTTKLNIFKSHYHIIMPFMVDPRIDFSVYPMDSVTAKGVSKRVSVPFAPDKSYLKATSNSYAERPLLEKIIRERFSQANQTIDSGTATEELVSYVKSFKAIKDEQIIDQVFSDNLYKLSEQSAFAQYLAIIQALMYKLVDAMRVIHHAQSIYYWLPQPTTKFGPETGSDVRKLIVSQKFPVSLVTPKDLELIFKTAESSISGLSSSVSKANSIPDPGSYAFSGFKLTFSPDSSSSMANLSTNTLDSMTKRRKAELTKAGAALQTIEMIMGEFSGFGLVDIIAIIGALYVMPKNDLLGFLDEDAWTRAKTTLGSLVSNAARPDSIRQPMESLSKMVKNFYVIMDKIFEDYRTSSGPNTGLNV